VCTADAQTACEGVAVDKELDGAAKKSFARNCVADAVDG